ncbi:MAG: hypothetical protein O2894_11340 [Planctomycetota bacterium]|nr:hypothetical protein [Planctomycetota bacterium]
MDYEHIQRAPLHWLLVVPGTAMVVSAWYDPEQSWVAWLLSIVGALMVALSLCFRHLVVRDEGERLRVVFGPLPFFRTSVAYSRIQAVRPARSALLDGWGIHFRPGAGWIWNLWGFDCVTLDLDNGSRFRIGTDDVAGLVAHVRARLDNREARS